jgi:hypothetical protein
MGLIPSLRPENIPEPLFLGDFAKLFDNRGKVSRPFELFSDAIEVKVENANNLQRVMKAVERSRPCSLPVWNDTVILEQSQIWREECFGVQVPFRFPENEAAMLKSFASVSVLMAQHMKLRSNSEFKELLAMNRRESRQVLIRLLAIISSGLGMNAYDWSRNILQPVIVTFEGNEILGLVPNTVFEESGQPRFFVAEDKCSLRPLRRWRKVSLIAANSGDGSTPFTKCIFPKRINYSGWERWKNSEWYGKNKDMY